MNIEQPKPESKKYADLISEIEKGAIKIPQFQRDFVWSIDKTAKLLDSILKGYPIGTFILWRTDERINTIKNVGNLPLPPTPDGVMVQYVLDGQQRITSLFAAFRGAKLQKAGEKKVTDYASIVVNLDEDLDDNDGQVITAEPLGEHYISLSDVLNLLPNMPVIQATYSPEHFTKIFTYANAFSTYDFSTVILRKEDIEAAIEVFTRINTGGETLTLFEIMSAKTYDEQQGFDMQVRWEAFSEALKDRKYDGVSSSVVLNLLSLILSGTKECKRKTILGLQKQAIIDTWDAAIAAIADSIDYFKTTYRIPVSQILPYDSLLVPFAYFFYHSGDKPQGMQRKLLEEFFWRVSLSFRYSSSAESKLAQDVRRIDDILKGDRPDYADVRVYLDSPQSLIDTNFSAGNSYCKAVLCLLAYHEPKDFQDNGKVILDNSWLKMANSRNYHHVFPKAYLRGKTVLDSNSLVNIVFVSDHLNKRKIGAKAPSVYLGAFSDENSDIAKSLDSHLIGSTGFGLESDDYGVFLAARAQRIFDALKARVEMTHAEPANGEIEDIIRGGESETVEFKSTLRYDLRSREVNKKLEFVIAKTIAAFLNSEGGDLFIGVDDQGQARGLLDDMQSLRKGDRDGFLLQLNEVISKYIGAAYHTYVKVTFPCLDSAEICRVSVSRSSRPVFIQHEGRDDFFVRTNCASTPLSREDQSVYEREHWLGVQ